MKRNRIWSGTMLVVLMTALLGASSGCYGEPEQMISSLKPYESSKGDLLRSAAFSGDLDRIVRLLKEGAKVNEADRDGWTPLMWAQAGSQPDAVKLLLNRGAQPDVRDKSGYTALHHAAIAGRMEVMEVLLERGAAPDTVSRTNWTPLMDAAVYGRVIAVELLLARGANPNATNRNGYSALMLAEQKGHQHVAVLLIANGADPEPHATTIHAIFKPTEQKAGGSPNVRLAGLMRNPQLVEALCNDCPAPDEQGTSLRTDAEAAFADQLAKWCQRQRQVAKDRGPRGMSVATPVVIPTPELQAAAVPAVYQPPADMDLLVREAVEMMTRFKAIYPDLQNRRSDSAAAERVKERAAQLEPLLNRALTLLESLRAVHPSLAQELLNLAVSGRQSVSRGGSPSR